MEAFPARHPPSDAKYWDAALETQPRAQWDALKLRLF